MVEAQGDEKPGGGGQRGADAYGVGRLLAFSDGVFAIAITLLVLNIPIPNLPGQATGSQLLRALLGETTGLVGFGVSFYVVGAQWFVHHRLLRGVEHLTSRLMWLNLLMLLFVCLLPFTTGVLIRYGYLPLAVQLYALNVALAGIVAVGLRIHLNAREWSGRWVRSVLRSLASPAAFLISIPIASWNPSYAFVVWVVVIPLARFAPLWTEDATAP